MRECLICGTTREEVDAVRRRHGYTLGCGIESNTEAGFDYEELSPRHRWSPWRDSDLDRAGIRPNAFSKYRTATHAEIQYAACEDTKQGHVQASDELGLGLEPGQCFLCGKNGVCNE